MPLTSDFQPLIELTSLLRTILGHNFIPALGMIAGVLIGLGYQRLIDQYGYCPCVIATGGLSCGKTTSLLAALSTIGSQRTG